MRGDRRRHPRWTSRGATRSRISPLKYIAGTDAGEAESAESLFDKTLSNSEMEGKTPGEISTEGERGSPTKAKNMKRDRKDSSPNVVSANYHTYQSLDDAWKSTDEGFANLTKGDIDFLEKLYASQRDSAAKFYFLKSKVTADEDDKGSFFVGEGAAMECIIAASRCPPAYQTLVDDWVDPKDRKRISLMQVVAARGCADEYLIQELKSKNTGINNRTGNTFERSFLETSIMHFDQKDLLTEIEADTDMVEELESASPPMQPQPFLKKNTSKSTERRQSIRVSGTSSPNYTPDSRSDDKRSNKAIVSSMNRTVSCKKQSSESRARAATALGKRQRFYLDQWLEEDYLEKSKQTHLFTTMRRWDDLLVNYSDNHDGFYREWMQSKITPQTHYDDPSKRARKNRETVVVLPPPVPSSVHHPACWGVNTRVPPTLSKNRDDHFFEKIHPACASASIVLPSGHYISEDVDDIDSLNIEYEFLRQQLVLQETHNFLTLRTVKDLALRATGLATLENKCESLQRIMYSFFKVMSVTNLKSKAHLDFNLHPLRPLVSTNDCDINGHEKYEGVHEEMESILSDTSSGDGMNKISPSRKSSKALMVPRVKALGGCPVTHIPHGSTLLSLKVGDLCDALLSVSVDGSVKRWTVCAVRKLDFEGGVELRNIKLSRAGSSVIGDCEWIAVEDGRIMPLHTYTNPSEQALAIKDVEQQRAKQIQSSLAIFEEHFKNSEPAES